MAKIPSSFLLFSSLFLCLLVSKTYTASDMSIISFDNVNQDLGGRPDDEVMSMYESWMAKHGKTYNTIDEKERRFQIFKDNLRYIDQQNAAADRSYKLGLNRFADLTNEEYRKTYFGVRPDGGRRLSSGKKSDRYEPKLGDSLPDSSNGVN